MRPDVVVVGAEAVQLDLELAEGLRPRWRPRYFFRVWWKRSTWPQVWGS
ncbi:MAG: hypothetical protein M3173_08000 [Chloroflexota bacterium]|nr:hypothetical protein [Chloroflexota bacterium]